MGNVGVEHAAPRAIVGALAGARAVDKGRREVEAGQLRERGLMAAVDDPMDSRRLWVAYGGVKERRRCVRVRVCVCVCVCVCVFVTEREKERERLRQQRGRLVCTQEHRGGGGAGWVSAGS
jgi:hypothetical protein